ncbi:hypothetical protein [Microbispora sp. NBC_01389]|uniref:DUF7224 domain-containing protein n=1 Tax=Microbispora sp. NBC_01389 TaxID=2903584 RepID=UPI0032547ECF
MPWLGRLRSSAAVYVLPVVIILAALQARRELGSMDLYWPAVSAMAGSAVGVIAPVYSAVAAWEGGRLKRGGVEQQTYVRPWWTIVLDAVALPLLGAACALLAALPAQLPEIISVPGAPDWRFMGVSALVCAGFTIVGFGVGRLLKPVYAVPICLVGTYLWLAYPISMQPLWLRHLTGNYDTACCRFDEIPDWRALAAGTLVGLAIAATGVGLSVVRRQVAVKRSALGLASLSLVVCAVILVRDMSWAAAVPRSAQDLVCERSTARDALTVCLWPEHAHDAERAMTASSHVVDRLVAAGLRRPTTLTEGPAEANAWTFSYRADLALLPWGIASGLVPQDVPRCQDEGGQWLTGDMVLPLMSWVAHRAGATLESVETRAGAETAAVIREVTRRPANSQLSWFRENLRLLGKCDVDPVKIS